jgi:hypothetical protein
MDSNTENEKCIKMREKAVIYRGKRIGSLYNIQGIGRTLIFDKFSIPSQLEVTSERDVIGVGDQTMDMQLFRDEIYEKSQVTCKPIVEILYPHGMLLVNE